MTNREKRRIHLMPGGIPKYIRCYDNGGGSEWFCKKCLHFSDAEDVGEAKRCPVNKCDHRLIPVGTAGTFDRYTVVYSGNYAGRGRGRCEYVGMSTNPFHPQGFGQHGEHDRVIDTTTGFPPKVGDKSPFGARRITFQRLPPDCQRLVISDYMDTWDLKTHKLTK